MMFCFSDTLFNFGLTLSFIGCVGRFQLDFCIGNSKVKNFYHQTFSNIFLFVA